MNVIVDRVIAMHNDLFGGPHPCRSDSGQSESECALLEVYHQLSYYIIRIISSRIPNARSLIQSVAFVTSVRRIDIVVLLAHMH